MNCENCKKEIPEDFAFCPHCGRPITKEEKKEPWDNQVELDNKDESIIIPVDKILNKSDASDNSISQNSINKKGKRKKTIGLLVSILVVVVILLYVICFSVPNLVGKSEEDAISALKNRGIEYNIIYDYCEDTTPQAVYEQSENALVPLFTIDSVTLHISKGYYVEIPDIRGMDIEDALQKLEDISPYFKINKLAQSSKTEKINNVISYDIKNANVNDKITSDARIDICICTGIIKELPNIVGMSILDAEAKLEELGITIKKVYAYSEDCDKDIVISTIENEYVEGEKTKITVNISKGKDDRGVIPSTIGKDANIAKKELEELGCIVTVEYKYLDRSGYNVTGEDEDNLVDDQDIFGKSELKNPAIRLIVKKAGIKINAIKLDINSAGGVDTRIELQNISNQQIKYVTITCEYYDAVGEKAYCEIKRTYKADVRATGPIDVGKVAIFNWEAVIYNSTVAAIFPKKLSIEYMDGSLQSLDCIGYCWSTPSYYGGNLNNF